MRANEDLDLHSHFHLASTRQRKWWEVELLGTLLLLLPLTDVSIG